MRKLSESRRSSESPCGRGSCGSSANRTPRSGRQAQIECGKDVTRGASATRTRLLGRRPALVKGTRTQTQLLGESGSGQYLGSGGLGQVLPCVRAHNPGRGRLVRVGLFGLGDGGRAGLAQAAAWSAGRPACSAGPRSAGSVEAVWDKQIDGLEFIRVGSPESKRRRSSRCSGGHALP